MSDQYLPYLKTIEVFKKIESYNKILTNIDYYHQYLTDLSMFANNFFAMPTSFIKTYSCEMTNDDSIERKLVSMLENIQSAHMLDLGILIDNCIKTIYSFRLCIEVVHISDALTLFRRLKDDLLLVLYFVRLSNPNQDDYSTEDNLKEWNKCVKDAGNWASNRMKDVNYTKIFKLLKEDTNIVKLDNQVGLFEYLVNVTKELNNRAHSNGMYFLNDPSPTSNRKGASLMLDYINQQLDIVMAYILTILYYLSPSYLASTDYVDYLDAGMEPLKGCENDVAYYHQEYIDTRMCAVNSHLKKFLIEHTGMSIE